MAVKLYLHIGYPKCGSTTIQEALHINRMALRKLGYGVCDGDLDLMNAKSSHEFPVGFFRKQYDAVRAGKAVDLEPAFAKLAKSASREKLKAVVISAENLGAAWAPSALACAQQYFDCKFISYFRRQDDWLVSSWAQWQFKSGESLQAYLTRRMRSAQRGVYKNALAAYLAEFPREKISLRFLSRAHLKDGDLATDFWREIGLSQPDLQPVQSKNISFSAPLATVLKESPYLFRDAHDNKLTSFIDAHHQYRGKVKKDPLTVAQRREILEKFQAENRWIEETFFTEGELGNWRALPETDGAQDAPQIHNKDSSNLRGLSEALNLNLAVLRSLREDVDKIKRSLGLK
ncbi:sulfotransferase [Kordiimonas aestuarii]|uniref:sulfotransferase n=1 Tax=Kordiimonas aestuarii TaxID=1005925 RepID=UPI0021D150A6|nr:sulfotransferase [Kordiimonas aestuarii]